MSHSRDSSPVYYREIQKNAYLKRIPDEVTTGKTLGLRPLGLKKAPLKPLWTQLCVHNGRTPYLEQYRDMSSARAHRPVWRASLLTARHVTASVTARDNEYDFLVDTHDGPVRMLAPDWESMRDWVSCLRSRLLELKILPPCENVYCAPPAAPAPRAAARDPTSPLPAAPRTPDRIPGIDLTPLIRNAVTHPTEPAVEEISSSALTSAVASTVAPNTSTSSSNTYTSVANTSPSAPNTSTSSPITSTSISNTEAALKATKNTSAISTASPSNILTSTSNILTSAPETIDISSWEVPETSEPYTSLPSTSQVPKSVTKICGQNVCLDDSLFKRTCESDDDDFLSDRSSVVSKEGSLGSKTGSVGSKEGILGSKECVLVNEGRKKGGAGSEVNNYKQTVVVSDKVGETAENGASERSTNITVIQVSNKEPPHTAIPVIGPETDIFDFSFKSAPRNPNFVNIVNTEVNVQNSNEYGTVFSKNEPEYGHLSLTTTVSLTGDVKLTGRSDSESLYEKLCLASTSSELKSSPLSIRRLKSQEKVRKSSLPNLDSINSDSTYEYLFLSQNNNSRNDILNSVTAQSNVTVTQNLTETRQSNVTATQSNVTATQSNVTTTQSNVTATQSNVTATQSNVTATQSNLTASQRNVTPIHRNVRATQSNVTVTQSNATTTQNNTTPIHRNVRPGNIAANNTNIPATNITTISTTNIANDTNSRVYVNSVSDVDPTTRLIRSNLERSNSQNTYDLSPRREARIEQNNGVNRNGKVEKIEPPQPKPLWKRGLTELSLLTRLRHITHGKRHESPERQERAPVSSSGKAVLRSRPEVRTDRTRRRSSSLSNGHSPPSPAVPSPAALQTLRARQAATLRSEQRRGAALVAAVRCTDPPIFADYNKQVWVSWWGVSGARVCGRAGDRVCGVRGAVPRDAAHARALLTGARAHAVDILFHRVPLGKIYVINKRDQESTGIKLDSECNITSVESDSPAALAGIPPPGKWAVTEVNNRPINLVKVSDEEINRLSLRGTEASVLIQPSALVKKLRTSLKGNKTLLGLR